MYDPSPFRCEATDGKFTPLRGAICTSSRYPDPKGMVDAFHQKGVRVIFWITQMIDEDSSNYAEGKEKDYYLKCDRTG